VRIASNAALTLYDEPIYMEFPGEFLEHRALSSAACFVTYRRLPAYKKPNGGRSDPPPYNPRLSLVLPLLSPRRYSALSTALSHPASPPSRNGGLPGVRTWAADEERRERERKREREREQERRDRITPPSVLTAKTRNWRTM